MEPVRAQAEGRAVPPADALLAAVLAHHLDDGSVEEGTSRVVSGSLVVECSVDQVSEHETGCSAACFFLVSGAPFGHVPVFASISGIGSTPEGAVANGGAFWGDMFVSLLRVADGGEPDDVDVSQVEVTLDGRRFSLVVTSVDRWFGDLDRDQLAARVGDLRVLLGGSPWLLPGIVRDGRLPVLTGDDATLVSLFVGDLPGSRTVELKVHGADWDTVGLLDGAVERPPGLSGALLRELAVLVPLDAAQTLTRSAVQRTLDGLATRRAPRQVAGWQGWSAHGGVLGPVLDDAQVAAVEAGTGPLPDDVRDFLTRVAGPGAGPGYGLLPLRAAHGVVPLAHAGCGNSWVLRLDGAARGTVWMDASGSDETTTQVAPSFAGWFADWLDAAVRDQGPWVQYDVACCATIAVLSQVLTAEEERAAAAGEPAPTSLAGHLADGSIRLTGGGNHLPAGPLDPCHGCVSIAASLSLPPSVFAPGTLTAEAP